MKVSVYRPREPAGLGAPKAYLGEEHPTEGDWIQSARAEISDDEKQPHRLLILGRAFLIYSMYHAREPRFLAYAIEHFGAACRRLGYILPLKDTDANWLTYGAEGLDPGEPEDYQFMLRQIAAVFGDKSALEQARELHIDFTPQPRPSITPEELAERMKLEILEDVKNGLVPPTVKNFSELHDSVDANCYGGTEALLDDLDKLVPDTDEGHAAALAAMCDLCNAAQEIINDWIAAGGISDQFAAASKASKRPRGPRGK